MWENLGPYFPGAGAALVLVGFGKLVAAAFRQHLAWGLDAKLFSSGNTEAYVATEDSHIVVAFRGTEAPTSLDGLKDWLLTDANNYLILPEGLLGTDFAAAGVGARFHRGFMSALAAIWDPVCVAVEAELKKKERPLWVTGHSLGGALALPAQDPRRLPRLHVRRAHGRQPGGGTGV